MLVGVATVAGALWWGQRQFEQIPTFEDRAQEGRDAAPEPEEPLALPTPLEGVTTFLVFSTGSENMTEEEARQLGITDYDDRDGDGLTDSIILAVLDPGSRELSLLSIPRDTWSDARGSRINEVYKEAGAQAFADEVTALTGIPVNHMVAVNFAAAARLTDVVGGIDVDIPAPMRDEKAHLSLPTAGCVHMDGETALAFMRSRSTQVWSPEQGWYTDSSASDFGRSSRQQAVITIALRKLLSPRLPLYLNDLASAAKANLVIDEALDMGDLVDTARVLASGPDLQVHHLGLPSVDDQVGEAAVLRTDTSRAGEVLAPLVEAVPGARMPDAYAVPDSSSEAGGGEEGSEPTPEPAREPTQEPAQDAGGEPTDGPGSSASASPRSSSTGGTVEAIEGFDPSSQASYASCSGGQVPDPEASPSL